LINSHLNNAQNVQFMIDVKQAINPVGSALPPLGSVLAEFNGATGRLDAFFQQNRKMFETPVVVDKDSGRDFTNNSLAAKITYLFTYAPTKELKNEAYKLYFEVDTFRHASKKDYKSETAYIRKLIAGLRKYPALLTKYELTQLVDTLETQNEEFFTVYDERSQARQAQQLSGNMRLLRRAANAAFTNVCTVVEGMLLTPLTAGQRSDYNDIALNINRYIEEYTIRYHRHAGITHPGGSNPPPQPPDAPDAPDTIPQPPNITPPTIDPDELNPPAVGER
jgi:hypothetical protein